MGQLADEIRQEQLECGRMGSGLAICDLTEWTGEPGTCPAIDRETARVGVDAFAH